MGATWLSPIFKSPMVGKDMKAAFHLRSLDINAVLIHNVDFGYDISDYEAIQPEYGTMDDLIELVAKATELGKRT